MNIKKVLMLLLVAVYFTGCARTVSLEKPPLKIRLTLTFRGNTNADTIYIIPFSKRINPIIFFQPLTNELSYMPIPGFGFNQETLISYQVDGSLKPFYDQIYKTWDKFIIIYDNKIELFEGIPFGSNITEPFTVTDNIGSLTNQEVIHTDSYLKSETFRGRITTSEENNTLRGLGTNTLTLTLEINQLGFEENERLYYGVLTLKKLDFLAGAYQDSTTLKGQSFSYFIDLSRNQTIDAKSNFQFASDSAADLTTWYIEVL